MKFSFFLAVSAFSAPPASRPITKVVRLLEDMRKTLDKEQKTDKELHEKMDCWCKTNKKEKTAAILAAQQMIENLSAVIEETAAKAAVLKQAIKNLEAEIAKDQDSLAAAQEQRLKEQNEFQEEEKDMLETIDALTQAVAILGKTNGEGGKEEAASALIQVQSVLAPFKAVMQKDLWDFLGNSKEESGHLPTGLTQTKQSLEQVLNEVFDKPVVAKTKMLQQTDEAPGAAAGKSYNSRSGEIFGILKQMKDTFSSNLSQAQKEEMLAKQRFKELSAALQKEIAAATEAKNDKTSQLAEKLQRHAQAKADIKDTKAALSADERFQMQLEERCAMEDKNFGERQKTRSDEIQAVSETIGFLTNEDARDLFSRTFNNFLQTSSRLQLQRRHSAVTKLMQVAKKTRSLNLASLAVSLKLDGFERVKKVMDDMLVRLKKEQKNEYEQREWCTKELDANEDSLLVKNRLRDDLESMIQDIEGTITTLKSESKDLRDENAEMQKQLKRTGEDRARENAEFQSTIADQRATTQILKKALARLQKFYNAPTPKAALTQAKPAKKSFLQEEPENVPGRSVGNKAAPEQAKYSKQGASGGVVALIQAIIDDAGRIEADAMAAEQDSQKGYEEFVQSTNASVRANQHQLTNKALATSQAQADLATTKDEFNGTMGILEKLTGYSAAIHSSCDFVVKNFYINQKARQEELEAIEQAKAILSGSNFEG